MKRWRCEHCYQPGNEADTEWEDHLTQSFCRQCGKPGTRIYEFGCFACDDQGRIWWDTDAPSHPCPDCNSPAYRIVHATYVATSDKRADYKAADAMLETELMNQNRSLSTFERNTRPPNARVESAREQAAAVGGIQGGWVSPSQVIGRAMPGSQANPLGTMPRPNTTVVGSFTGEH